MLPLLLACASADVYSVKWQVQPNSTQLVAGTDDSVLFDFSSGHAVVQMPSAEALAACSFTNAAVLATSGPFTFAVPSDTKVPTTFYFACNVDSHCLSGMRLTLVVSEAPTGPSPTHAPTTSASGYTSGASRSAPLGLVLWMLSAIIP